MVHIKRFIFAFLIVFTCSCETIKESTIPIYRVFLEIDLSFQDKDLYPLLAQKAITKQRTAMDYLGFGGILITHGFDDNYYAFDLCCPTEANRNTLLSPLSDGTAKCGKCGTIYDTAYGTGAPIKGKGEHVLRTYKINKKGNLLIVTN